MELAELKRQCVKSGQIDIVEMVHTEISDRQKRREAIQKRGY